MMTPLDPTSPAAPAELVRRILAGEAQAEVEMVERFSRGVKFLLLELTRDPARADDLHQETFRLALEKVRDGELRDPDKLAAFIRQIARNLFIAEYRKGVKQPTVSGGGADDVAPPPDPAPSPLARLLAKENATIVRRLLAELEPERDRQILFRFFIAEHRKEDICAAFDLSSLHFNRVLHRARGRLKDLVQRYHKRQRLPGFSEAET
ncbi:MAG: sigma-70 family RNA polymerase sigma factor [Acidobacteriota bacterium]